MSDSFGGKIELTGESEYRQALTKISQNLRVVSAEMKATSTGFASGDKSTKDLTNASKTLNEALSKQKTALESLKRIWLKCKASMQKQNQNTLSL